MLQAAILDCQFFDLFPFSDDGFVSPEVDIRRCDVSQALVVTLGVVIVDEDTDLLSQIAWQVVVFQKYAVLDGLVPAFVVRAYAAPLGPRSLQLPCVCGWKGAPRMCSIFCFCIHSASSPEM